MGSTYVNWVLQFPWNCIVAVGVEAEPLGARGVGWLLGADIASSGFCCD